MGYILAGDELKRYAETRLFGTNVTPEIVDKIELHNGILPSQLLQAYAERGEKLTLVEQVNAREPLFYRNGVLHIPQYSGFGRARRYRHLIKRYSSLQQKALEFTETNHEGRTETNMAYENYAYDFIKELSYKEPFTFLDGVIIGNTEAVAKQTKVLRNLGNEYLDAQIIKTEGTTGEKYLLNFGYVYGDQAGILLNKFLRHWDGDRLGNGKEKFSIYTFGRFGSLEDKKERQDIVTPTQIINESDLVRGKALIHPIDNCFSNENHESLNLNVRSVVDETTEHLLNAREQGASTVDMELFEMTMAINQARERYYDGGEKFFIEFGALGYVSDKPLHGDTLAKELGDDTGEQAAISEILEHAANN
ncbi:hypothetical protein GOV10_05390 [Candidatus Woesearchaeota archaeon]|nr:hypothetical protein [Candidatus Woesearchaeota archaeon]